MKNKKKILFIAILSLILVGMIVFSTYNVKKSSTILSIKNIQSDISTEELAIELDEIKSNSTEPKYAEGEAIIMIRPTVSLLSIESNESSILNELDIEELANIESENTVSLNSLSDKQNSDEINISLVKSDKYTTEELIEKLEDDGIYAEPNYILHPTEVSNDTYLSSQWAIENNGQNGGTEGADINPISTTSTEEKVIAVIDTGVDYTHDDLKNVMWENPYSSSTDLPGQHGYDFGDDDTDPMDVDGHGTHCAGIIAAQSDNSEGITGAILANSNIKIMALKFMNSEGKQYTSAAIKAYNYIYEAQQKGINIVAINNSWGSYPDSIEDKTSLKIVIDIVGANGALSICANGNDSLNTDEKVHSPSGLDSDYIISVAASNVSDDLSDFSNYGSTTVDIAAPGSEILSTVPYNVFNPSIYTDNQISSLCSTYENFNNGSLVENTDYQVSAGTVTLNDEEYFGNQGKSAKWTINDAIKGQEYYIYFPYTINTIRKLL